MLVLGRAQPVRALVEQRVGVRGGEELLPPVHVEVVQPVRDVGEDAVDVEDRQRACALGCCAHPNSRTGLTMSAIATMTENPRKTITKT